MPKKKSADEARGRLQAKLEDVKSKTKSLHDFIDNISNEAILHAEKSLKETNKSKFLNGYSKASEQLESCLNKFLLISDAIETMNDSDEEEDEDEEDDDEADENETMISASTAIDSSTFVSTAASTILNGESVCTITEDKHEEITPSVLRKRSTSQESLFSSVSMQRHSTPKLSNTPVTLSKDMTVNTYKWERGVAYPVLITNFISPWEFYIQLVNPQNDVMEQMCISFMKQATCGYKGGVDTVPEVGSFCCAKYEDNTWYRAKVLEVYQDNSQQDWTVKVFFIDEGFFSVVGATHLRPLDKKYADMLPCQAFHCILGGVQPIAALEQKNKETLGFNNCSKLWSSESIAWFKEKMDLGLFAAYFYSPPTSAFTKPHMIDQDVLVCDLYIHLPDSKCKLWQFSYERPDLECHVGYKLIVEKMSVHCGYLESELNREATQRLLKEILCNKKTDQKKKETVSELNREDSQRLLKETFCLQKTDTKKTVATTTKRPDGKKVKEEKEPVPPQSNQQRLTFSKKSERIPLMEEKPPTKSSSKNTLNRHQNTKRSHTNDSSRRKKSNKNCNDRNRSYSSDSSSSTVSNKNRVISVDPTPMQIELASDAKNVPSNIVQLSRTPSPVVTPSTGIAQDAPPLNSPTSDVFTDDAAISNVIAVEERSYFKFGDTFQEIKLAVKKETFLKVVVSEVVNPGLFYIHLVSPEVAKLDDMMAKMNTFYNMKADEIREMAQSFLVDEGVAVIAKYPPDNRWYRALVVSKDEEEIDRYNVLYVDFGNSDVVSVHDILPVVEEFCGLPMETIACCLADVDPLSPLISSEKPKVVPAGDESSDEEEGVIITEIKTSPRNSSSNSLSRWSEKSVNAFKMIVLTELPLLAALKTCDKNVNGLYMVYLYDTTNDHDLFINQHLVDEGVVTSKVFSKKTPSNQTNTMSNEQGEMALWNPMEEQFFSKRNAYSVDEDNAAVAMLGYVEKEKEICHQFLRDRCTKGSGCRFAHIKPGDRPNVYESVFCTDDVIQMPELGDWVPITVTALLDPSHFWVNFPCGVEMFSDHKKVKENDGEDNPLIRLNESMSEYYSHFKRDDKTDLTILAEGEIVAAKFEEKWYRARVVNAAEDLVQVFFVDYGNTSVISEEDIRKLIVDFLHLPLQAVECRLNGVDVEDELKANNLILYSELRLKFQKQSADKLLMALVVARSPRKELILDIYDTTTNPHTYINKLVSTWNGMTTFKKVPNDVRNSSSNKSKVTMFPG